MNVGLVWPLAVNDYPDPSLLTVAQAGTGATHLRFDLDYRHVDPVGVIERVRDAGFQPLPILNFPYDHTPDLDRRAFLAFCRRIVDEAMLEEVELLNEPRVMGDWSGTAYGRFVEPVCHAVAGRTLVLLAGDYLQPDRQGPLIFPQWFEDVRDEVSDGAWDTVAWHTYREPASPETTRYASRHAEYHAMRRPLPRDCPVQVTEVGWNLGSEGMTLELQAEYLRQELDINLGLGIDATYLYSPIPGSPDRDFGLFHHDWTPRPAAEAVRQFQAGRTA